MTEKEFINDFYKGNDYRKFSILQEIYIENLNLKNKLNEIREYVLGAYEMETYTKSACLDEENLEDILQKISK